ncbi:hypothetical protein HMPREF9628_01319 [Peptoanaerobacter stomatis]|uniref:Uncharacterized protein n=1 Tax=Peptoanaerobacter stomatis TaxID=796937 RepID=G9XBF2_9FIRM|nr:hypothetical protein [Peptoanaerobacter stomatis]EHL19803.1 hypothetical protein HMPREF9628_01319 [Peptoanaerobacter stomatis]
MQMLINENLIDKAIRLDKEIKEKKKELDEAKAMLQADGLSEMENKNLKYLQIFGGGGSCDLSYKQKLEIENINVLKELFGNILDSKVSKREEVKYEVESKFKSALIALYIGDYKEHDIDIILASLGLDDNKRKLAMKKLKGEYIADKKLLESLGAIDEDGLEEELDIIKEYKNYELVKRYIDIDSIDDKFKNELKRAISIEDSLSLGLSYEK